MPAVLEGPGARLSIGEQTSVFVRCGCIWFLFFRGEGPAKAFYQGCGMAKATVLRIFLPTNAHVRVA